MFDFSVLIVEAILQEDTAKAVRISAEELFEGRDKSPKGKPGPWYWIHSVPNIEGLSVIWGFPNKYA